MCHAMTRTALPEKYSEVQEHAMHYHPIPSVMVLSPMSRSLELEHQAHTKKSILAKDDAYYV